MYTLTLEMNNICNLNCSYCYLGEKKYTYMKWDTIMKALNIAIHESKKQYDKTLHIYFMGGEPLLSFDMIVETTNYVISLAKENDLKLLFSITTNGTIYSEGIGIFLEDNKFDIRISLDGNLETQNLNRKYYDGQGSYEKIIENLPHFFKISNITEKFLKAVQVLTTNNIDFYFDNFKHLSSLGFKYIECGPNIYDNWTDEKIQVLFNNFTETISYIEIEAKTKNFLVWDIYHKKLSGYISNINCFYNCMAGMASIFVNTCGEIYFCKEMDQKFQIGTVDIGLNVKRIRDIAYIKETKNKKCLECKFKSQCSAKGCFVENYDINKNIYSSVYINCEITKYFYEYFKNKYSDRDIENLKRKMIE